MCTLETVRNVLENGFKNLWKLLQDWLSVFCGNPVLHWSFMQKHKNIFDVRIKRAGDINFQTLKDWGKLTWLFTFKRRLPAFNQLLFSYRLLRDRSEQCRLLFKYSDLYERGLHWTVLLIKPGLFEQ